VRRGGRQEAPAACLLDDRLKILVRLETQQRQTETVLAARLTVTAATVAAEFGEQCHNVGVEINGLGPGRASRLLRRGARNERDQ
jgi:hypothetical protein